MKKFETLSEQLIDFYSNRYSIEKERLSWAVTYLSEEGDTEVIPTLKIKDSDYFIDINHDLLRRKVPQGHDLVLFNMIDAWFSEADKNLRHGMESGRVISVDLRLEVFKRHTS